MKMVKVRWTGAAGLEFTHNGTTTLIDPYHSRVGITDLFFKRLSPQVDSIQQYLSEIEGKLASIIVSHTHFDHALDVPEFSKHYQGPLVGNQSMETLMKMHGIQGRVDVCKGGEKIQLPGSVNLTMIRSTHGLVALGRVPYPGEIESQTLPIKAKDYRHGTVLIPKVEIENIVFMHLGSANFIESEITGHDCDVLFMCLPGWKKCPQYTLDLLETLKPQVIVPFHFDNFTAPRSKNVPTPKIPLQGMWNFLKRVSRSAPKAEIRIPQMFQTMTF